MGYMRHYAIVVTSYGDDAYRAHEKAKEVFNNVSPLMCSYVNGYQSFFIPPDGSKMGWDDAEEGEDRRAQYRAWLDEQRFDDGSTSLQWIEVMYGDDEHQVAIVAHSDEGR